MVKILLLTSQNRDFLPYNRRNYMRTYVCLSVLFFRLKREKNGCFVFCSVRRLSSSKSLTTVADKRRCADNSLQYSIICLSCFGIFNFICSKLLCIFTPPPKFIRVAFAKSDNCFSMPLLSDSNKLLSSMSIGKSKMLICPFNIWLSFLAFFIVTPFSTMLWY